jgi:hypothetical protein
MERIIRDGLVAVIVSPGHGAGWYSWHGIEELLFDPSIVEWIEKNEYDKIKHYITLKYPDEYFGDVEKLSIRWIAKGTAFKINEYDGSESVSVRDKEEWIVA